MRIETPVARGAEVSPVGQARPITGLIVPLARARLRAVGVVHGAGLVRAARLVEGKALRNNKKEGLKAVPCYLLLRLRLLVRTLASEWQK